MENFKKQLNEFEFYELQTVLDWAEERPAENIIEFLLFDAVKVLDTQKPLCLRKYPADCKLNLKPSEAVALFAVMQKVAVLDKELALLSWELHKYINEKVAVPVIAAENLENTENELHGDRSVLQLGGVQDI